MMNKKKHHVQQPISGEYYPIEYLIALGQADTSWMRDAACSGMDTELFFESRGVADSREARAVCSECPVSSECLEYALDFRMVGIWGGTNATERTKIIRGGRKTAVARSREEKAPGVSVLWVKGEEGDGRLRRGAPVKSTTVRQKKYSKDLIHGRRSTYTGGCRCEPCRTASREYDRLRARERAAREVEHFDGEMVT